VSQGAAAAQLLPRQLEIQPLKLQIGQLKRMQYGRSSEQQNELELTLEDLEAALGAVPVASITPIANMAHLPRAPSYTN
jgi:transposase